MRKKSLLLLILLVTLFVVSCSSKKQYEEPHFIHYNTSFYAEKESDYTLVLNYLINKNSNDYLVPSEVESIRFKDAKNVEIKKFNFFDSESSKVYKVKNIELNLHFTNLGKENLTELEITFKDKSSKSYKIGNWFFNVESKDSLDKSPIEMGEDYAIVSAVFDGYLINLKNMSGGNATINDLLINLKEVQIDKPSALEFDSSGNVKIKIPATIGDRSYKFYIIRPKVMYTYKGQKHSYFPYASLYGVINVTDADFENEYKKTKTRTLQ
ncbi:hypothetical protein [Cohnella abietis]|uniref:Lipoprotein n=1 Tax=Cohnella abietis TaxID=2507935 RepID=A0A3T1D982_9BACL|nr:hypothetical protein [Cohnella abietis]BBI34605.1 hypothetical protein KCTCHS21_40040 [Cohnella abietis]